MRFNQVVPVPVVFLFLFLTWFTRPGEVTIEHDLPKRIEPGKSKEVTLRVKKGERAGFAKLELQIPEGVTVKAVEKSGASFTFEDGIAKFIWMAMPKGGQFFVKYRLKAKQEAEGKQTIRGDLRYIEDNERKRVEVRKRNFRIEKGKKKLNKEQEKDPVKDTGKVFKLERKVKKIDERRFRVRLKVHKKGAEGFAKLVDRVPNGFDVAPEETMGASFTFQDRKTKFVWMQLPSAESFWVQYTLRAQTAEPGSYRIQGSFSFLKNENSMEKNTPVSSFKVTESLEKKIAADTSDPSSAKEGRAEADKASSDAASDASSDVDTVADSEEEKGEGSAAKEERQGATEDLTDDVPAPQKGIDYRVQICAGHDPVKEGHFSKVYGYKGDYDIDHHDGWIKYLTGTFERYKKARDKRAHFRNNYELPGPFVTAYNDGERVTVQEALMVTDQEWAQ